MLLVFGTKAVSKGYELFHDHLFSIFLVDQEAFFLKLTFSRTNILEYLWEILPQLSIACEKLLDQF